ncbi:hypothetical protein V6N13_131342 [Hibiscus sabdariffa]
MFKWKGLVGEVATALTTSSGATPYDGTYAMKKVLIQNSEQLELVREEIRVSSLFSHPNLLLLLDHAIISIKLSASSSIMLMSGLGFMCRNGHLSTVQHLFELLSCGTA